MIFWRGSTARSRIASLVENDFSTRCTRILKRLLLLCGLRNRSETMSMFSVSSPSSALGYSSLITSWLQKPVIKLLRSCTASRTFSLMKS